jgi:uncharacterized protein YprB with RNaseH-like and TPR domain/predicted nuclease with RNAse H fold
MIKSTFIFVPGIGEKTEENLWKNSILTWYDLKERAHIIGLSKTKRTIIEDYLDRAEKALDMRDASFFATHLPQKEYWRLYKEFRDKALFLDIETTGLSRYYDKITLIGASNERNKIKIFVRDNNLDEALNYLQNYEMIVTFNGKLFDIPFIMNEFPEAKIPPIHIDLRYLLRTLGVTGPLKKIEGTLNISRPKEVQEVNGREAAVLWSRFVKGDDSALEKLLLYNIYDVVNLQDIMDLCYKRKIETIMPKMNHDPSQQKLVDSLGNKSANFQLDTSFKFNIPEVTTRYVHNGLLEAYLNTELLFRINRKKIEKIEIEVDSLIQKIRNRNRSPVSVGIDLSGSEERNSGFCILQENKAYLEVLKTDDELISKTVSVKPTVISIDSPLSLPKDRCCADDSCECRKYGITRECERILKKRGINVYPCLIKSMQKLTLRGIKLAKIFGEHGYEVIESYPGAAQDILGIPRKRVNLKALETDLRNMGTKVYSERETITHDELDALTSALVGYFYLAGDYEAIGNIDEEYLIIPSFNKQKNPMIEMTCL